MITQVDNIDMVPDDIKELLLPDSGDYVAIGNKVYELKQFPIKKYFELLHFMSKYFTKYNLVYKEDIEGGVYGFLGTLAGKLLEENLIEDFLNVIFPEIKEENANITYPQLKYLLGVIYKLNFLSTNHQIQNMEMRLAHDQMMKMLGLNLMNSE